MAAPAPATDPSAAPSATPSAAPSAASAPRTTFALGTRKSPLALAQTDIVLARLQAATAAHAGGALAFPVVAQTTAGDQNQVTALHQFDAKALWTTELEADLLAGTTDLVVHSLKDLPTQLPAGCRLGAALARTERRDCVVMAPRSAARGWTTLADLPTGSVVGTSSVRRLAQLRAQYPGLATQDVRGNVGTRLRKLDADGGAYAALILAATGLQRLGLGDRVSSFLSRREGAWLGAVGQGAVGVETRHGDAPVAALCARIMEPDGPARHVLYECLAERSLLRALEGGCSVPIAVESEWRRSEAGDANDARATDAAPSSEAGDANEARTTEAAPSDKSTAARTTEAAPPNGTEPAPQISALTSAAAPTGAAAPPSPTATATDDADQLVLHALVASVDGRRVIERALTATVRTRAQAEDAGLELARRLVDGGAAEILRGIVLNRGIVAAAGGA